MDMWATLTKRDVAHYAHSALVAPIMFVVFIVWVRMFMFLRQEFSCPVTIEVLPKFDLILSGKKNWAAGTPCECSESALVLRGVRNGSRKMAHRMSKSSSVDSRHLHRREMGCRPALVSLLAAGWCICNTNAWSVSSSMFARTSGPAGVYSSQASGIRGVHPALLLYYSYDFVVAIARCAALCVYALPHDALCAWTITTVYFPQKCTQVYVSPYSRFRSLQYHYIFVQEYVFRRIGCP